MTQTLSLSPSTEPLGLNPVWRASVCQFQGATVQGITLYRAQMWRRPKEVLDEDVSAIATAYGSVQSGQAVFVFTDDQMDFGLVANNGEKDDIWLNIAGLDAGGKVKNLRSGWLTVVEPGCRISDFLPTDASFTVSSSRLVITFASFTYSAPVEEVTLPGGAVDGTYSVTGSVATFIVDGHAWKAPVEAVASPSGLENGGLLILSTVLYIMQSGQAYKLPVQAD